MPSVSFLLKAPISDRVEEVLKARSDSEALIAFRSFLHNQYKDLSSIRDTSELSRRSKAVMDELNRIHLPQANLALEKIKTKETLRWAAIAAGIGVAYPTTNGLVTVLAGLAASAEGLRAKRENFEQVKVMPGYFWSKITKG